MSRVATVRVELAASARRLKEARSRVEATSEEVQQGRSRRQILHDSAYARLQARLDTMPVIEQAKGILMAQHRCGPDQAFDMLRRASQHRNVKLSELAARIVEQVTAGEPGPVPDQGRPRASS